MKNALYFALKALFVLKIFKFSCWHFGHIEKRLDYKDKVSFIIHDITTWGKKQLQYTYCLISQEAMAIRLWNLVSWYTITWRTFFLKNSTQNVVEELFPEPVLKNYNWAYLWINSLKFYTVCFYCILSWGLSKYIKTKLDTTCFYLISRFFKK